MYNRYIPQPDGSFCRKQMPEAAHPKKPQPKPPAEVPCSQEPVPPPPDGGCKHCSGCRKKAHPQESFTPYGISSYFSQLLPKDFDTGDLMVILLLLLMAGDCPENQSNALLTLALYLFL